MNILVFSLLKCIVIVPDNNPYADDPVQMVGEDPEQTVQNREVQSLG